jgi:protein SHQ1
VKFNHEEKEILKKLGNKEFLLSKEDKAVAWLSLVDIVFAYAYNHRTTLGENSVESAWTINKLSATLSWFAVSMAAILGIT